MASWRNVTTHRRPKRSPPPAASGPRRGVHGDGCGPRLALLEAGRWDYQLVATNTLGRQLPDSRSPSGHRTHARVEDRVRWARPSGWTTLPSASLAINQAWCVAALIATDLLCWLRLLCLDRSLADAEPKPLRYRVLHTAARIVRAADADGRPKSRDLALEELAAASAAFALTAHT